MGGRIIIVGNVDEEFEEFCEVAAVVSKEGLTVVSED
jgi:hypothetical protein